MNMSNKLVERLSEEKFAGENLEWREGNWGDTPVLFVEDGDNWYYKKGGVIYIQAKKRDATPNCYDCGTEIEFVRQSQSEWAGQFTGPVGGGDVKLKHIPYCPKCEKKPERSGVMIGS